MPTALLIIDVQQELCEGRHAPSDIAAVIARINAVSAKARAARAQVILVQHEGQAGYLEYGTEGWQLARGLHVEPTDVRVRKTATDSFHRTELQQVLQQRGITADAHTSEGNEHLSPAQVVAHHNHTLANITSFGPRVRAIETAELRVGGVSWGCVGGVRRRLLFRAAGAVGLHTVWTAATRTDAEAHLRG